MYKSNNLKSWILNTDRAAREKSTKLSGETRIGALNQLSQKTSTRINPQTKEKEFLLHRGMSDKEHKVHSNGLWEAKTSWTPHNDIAHFILPSEDHSHEDDHVTSTVASAWIPEKHIHAIPVAVGGHEDDPRAKEIAEQEHEVIVSPHKIQFAQYDDAQNDFKKSIPTNPEVHAYNYEEEGKPEKHGAYTGKDAQKARIKVVKQVANEAHKPYKTMVNEETGKPELHIMMHRGIDDYQAPKEKEKNRLNVTPTHVTQSTHAVNTPSIKTASEYGKVYSFWVPVSHIVADSVYLNNRFKNPNRKIDETPDAAYNTHVENTLGIKLLPEVKQYLSKKNLINDPHAAEQSHTIVKPGKYRRVSKQEMNEMNDLGAKRNKDMRRAGHPNPGYTHLFESGITHAFADGDYAGSITGPTDYSQKEKETYLKNNFTQPPSKLKLSAEATKQLKDIDNADSDWTHARHINALIDEGVKPHEDREYISNWSTPYKGLNQERMENFLMSLSPENFNKYMKHKAMIKSNNDYIEPLEKKCPRCGKTSANKSNPSGRCRSCLNKLAANKKKPGHWQRAQTKADDALRRQDGKNGTAHHKSNGRGSRDSIVNQVKRAERKTGQKLSPDRKNNSKGYAASNTRMVPEKLNRGRHKVDGKKLRAWQKRLKKTDISYEDFYTYALIKAQESNNEKLLTLLCDMRVNDLARFVKNEDDNADLEKAIPSTAKLPDVYDLTKDPTNPSPYTGKDAKKAQVSALKHIINTKITPTRRLINQDNGQEELHILVHRGIEGKLKRGKLGHNMMNITDTHVEQPGNAVHTVSRANASKYGKVYSFWVPMSNVMGMRHYMDARYKDPNQPLTPSIKGTFPGDSDKDIRDFIVNDEHSKHHIVIKPGKFARHMSNNADLEKSEKLNRGRHKVDGKKLRAWQKRLKKANISEEEFYTYVLAKAQEQNNDTIVTLLHDTDPSHLYDFIKREDIESIE